MSKVILTCKGDNNWQEVFENEERAYWFLYGKLSDIDRYFENSLEHDDFAFDIEDDCITWRQGKKTKYCAGWHWPEFQDESQMIIMPNGRSLYEMFSELEN